MFLRKKIIFSAYGAYRIARYILLPLVPLYLLIYKLIRSASRPRNAGVPVICAGNITTGGAGKTPAVIYLASFLKEHGFSPGVVSRGYGGSKSGEGALVSDGELIFLSDAEAGDEPLLIAKNLGGVPVAVGKDRPRAINILRDRCKINIAVMDDGLQNFSIIKDISIAVLDAGSPFGNGILLPAGDLRERSKSLSQTDIIIINKFDLVPAEKLEALRKKVYSAAPDVPVFTACYIAESIVKFNDNQPDDPAVLNGKRVLAFAGIGNPRSFFTMVGRYKPALLETIAYPDHFRFSDGDIDHLCKLSRDYDFVITTEKDRARLGQFLPDGRFYYLKIRMEINGSESFRGCLLGLLKGRGY